VLLAEWHEWSEPADSERAWHGPAAAAAPLHLDYEALPKLPAPIEIPRAPMESIYESWYAQDRAATYAATVTAMRRNSALFDSAVAAR